MAKIGIDIRNIGKKRTGDEVVFFNLVKNLAIIDQENEYFLFTDILDQLKVDEIKKRLGISENPRFKIISLKSKNKFCWNFRSLPKYLKKNPIDIYHTQYITPFFISRKTKVLTMIHDISFNFFPQHINPLDLLFLKLLIPKSIRRADKIIGVSQFTRDEIIKYYKTDPKKVDFIYNGVGDNFKKDNFTEEEIRQAKDKYSLPKKFVLYIGTLQPRKNIPFLIEGYAGIKDKLNGVKLVLAGDKNAHNADKNIGKKVIKFGLENDVIFPGYIDEKEKAIVFSLAQALAFPSHYEGFGIPLLEAMSQNVPIAAANIPVFREVAADSALYFDPQNLDDLRDRLYNICIDEKDKNRLVNSGRNRVQLFSWEKSTQKLLGIYKELLDSK